MMEQNEIKWSVRCEKCDKEFNVPFNAANAFCVPVEPNNLLL